MNKILSKIITFSILLYSGVAFSGAPSVMTFQSKILSPSGTALEAASVNFRFTVLDSAGTCVLYVEDYSNVNMTGSQGVVAIPLGSGTKAYPPAAVSLYEVFNNSAASLNCQAGGTVTPTATDNRQVVMQFNDGSGWQTLPQMAINAVPFANYATRAESLGAYPAANYLRPATLPTCTASQALTWDGTTFTCLAAGGGGGSTYTGVTSIANASGDITLAPAAGTGAVQINSGAASTSPTTGALIVSGGVGVSGGIYSGGAISSGSTVSANTSMYTPQLYGTSTPSGNIRIDGTSDATKGNILLATIGGYVGIGTTNPTSVLDVRGQVSILGDTGSSNLKMQRSTANAFGPIIFLAKSRGDLTTPTYPLNGDTLGNIYFGNHAQLGVASISSSATENHSNNPGNPSGTNLQFSTSPNGTNNSAIRMTIGQDGNVGIGTASPSSKLHIQDGSLLLSGTTGNTPSSGAGTRMMWIPAKNAFRAGKVAGARWDDSSVGNNSVAFGNDTQASGFSSVVAGGGANIASGTHTSVAGGYGNSATYEYATVGGGTGNNAINYNTVVSGGNTNTASGFSSTVPGGEGNIAGGDYSWAGGRYMQISAAGDRTFAWGYSETPVSVTQPDSFIIYSGNVGIGTTSPAAKLDVADTGTTTSAIIVPRAGAFTGTTVNGMVRYNSTSNLFEFYQNGAWVNYTTVSDARLKTNVVSVTQGLDIVNQLHPVFYDWDKNNPRTETFGDKHQVGFIAQEVEKVLPEVVDVGEDSYRSVQYGKIVSVVVAAVKELYNKFMGLDAQQAIQARQIATVQAESAAKDKEIAALKAKAQKAEQENVEIKARLERIEKALKSK